MFLVNEENMKKNKYDDLGSKCFLKMNCYSLHFLLCRLCDDKT